jgi:anti-sigma factor ChrR (cupin superfamily)
MDPSQWEPGPVEGVTLFHLKGGPGTEAADVGLVRFPVGLHFPPHTHGVREDYAVLQGEILDSRGHTERAGDVVHNDHTVSHDYVIGEGDEVVIAITLHGGLEIL